MEIPSNLVSDSPLLRETFDFITANGGNATFADVVSEVFGLSHTDSQLDGLLIRDLVCNDPRFILGDDHIAISADRPELRPLREVDFVVLDVEAIGGKIRAARIIELAAYRVRAGEIVEEFQTLVNPEVPIPHYIAALTSLSDEMLKAAPAFPDVIHAWLAFAGDAVLVAHNSDFDVPLLNKEIERVFPGHRMRNHELCTVKLARRLVRGSSGHNLDALAEHFGFEIANRHRAAGDARATARVLLNLLDELGKHGVSSLGEALSLRIDVELPRAKIDVPLALDV